jgi:hypothetical protein
VKHVSCLVMCRCGTLRRSTAVEKVKRVRADGPGAVKNGRGGLDRGTEHGNIDKQVCM